MPQCIPSRTIKKLMKKELSLEKVKKEMIKDLHISSDSYVHGTIE
jgi:hypothetical protein